MLDPRGARRRYERHGQSVADLNNQMRNDRINGSRGDHRTSTVCKPE
jgi:hypothetical protein